MSTQNESNRGASDAPGPVRLDEREKIVARLREMACRGRDLATRHEWSDQDRFLLACATSIWEEARDQWEARDRLPDSPAADYDQYRRQGWNAALRELLAVLERKALPEETEKDRGWNVALEEIRRAVEVRQGTDPSPPTHGSPCDYALGFEDAIEQCANYVGSFDLAQTFRSFTCNGHGATSPKRSDGQ